MRLFISSENLGNHPDKFLKLLKDKRLAIIENASDDWTDKDRSARVKKHLDQLKIQGFEPTEIDLRNYFEDKDDIEKELLKYDGLFVFGGNTFILRRAFAYSGLDQVLTKLVSSDKLAYGGSSAGAIIITPTLHGSDKGDMPGAMPRGYKSQIIWDGLSLVDYCVVPHYGSDWWGKEALAMEEYLKENHLDYKTLSDGQVILVDGEKEELLK
jgi:dipeptidase E